MRDNSRPRQLFSSLLGVEAILQKPIEMGQFMAAVRRTLRSRRETWGGSPTPGGLPLHVALPSLAAANRTRRIAFGSGGFCLRCLHWTFPMGEGPVRFDPESEGERASFAGHGLIRWAEPDEGMLGVEISDLDESCREWAIAMIAAKAGSAYIPRAASLGGSKIRDCQIINRRRSRVLDVPLVAFRGWLAKQHLHLL